MTSYKSVSHITFEKYWDMTKHPIGKKTKKKLNTWFALNGIGTGAMSAAAYYCFKTGDSSMAVIFLAFVAMFAYKLFFQRKIMAKKQYEATIRSFDDKIWTRTVTFDDKITVADNNSVSTFKYSDFRYTGENNKYYLLYRNENVVLRIEKGSFITGDEAKFLKWINNKIK